MTELLRQISPADQQVYEDCIGRFNGIAKPLGSLGKLETLLARAAAASGTADVNLNKKCVLVFCADNGVVGQGVAQSTHAVTTAIGRSLVRGTASVNVMARAAGADTFPVDVGMVDTVSGLLQKKLFCGTGDISCGPAMSRADAETLILTGAELVREKAAEGYTVIAAGEAGIGNTTTSSAVAAVLLGLPVETVTGRGSGLSDAGLRRKQEVIHNSIMVNYPDAEDPLDVLAKVGGADLAAMTGAFLGGAACRVPMVIDGLIASVAALCAVRICPAVKGYLLPSHLTAEPAGIKIMEELGLEPMLHGDMRLGEGTGAVALFPMLDMAAAVYNHAATFADIQVEAYQKQV